MLLKFGVDALQVDAALRNLGSFRTSELRLDKGHANDDSNSHREARHSIDSEHNRNHAEVLQSVEYEQSPDCCAVEEERRQWPPPTAYK